MKGDSVALKFKQEDLARAEVVLDLIADRILRLRIEKGAPPRVDMLQRAKIPVAPIESFPYRNVGLAILAGFCAPFAVAMLKAQITRRGGDESTLGADGKNPRRILDAARYSWKWALPGGIILATAAALIIYLLFTPQYRASAWLRIERRAPFLAFESQDGAAESAEFVQTQIELIRSPMVLVRAMANLTFQSIQEISGLDNPTEWLKRKSRSKQLEVPNSTRSRLSTPIQRLAPAWLMPSSIPTSNFAKSSTVL